MNELNLGYASKIKPSSPTQKSSVLVKEGVCHEGRLFELRSMALVEIS